METDVNSKNYSVRTDNESEHSVVNYEETTTNSSDSSPLRITSAEKEHIYQTSNEDDKRVVQIVVPKLSNKKKGIICGIALAIVFIVFIAVISGKNKTGWNYYEENPSVPTADSCIDDIILESSFGQDGNKVYGYYVSDNQAIASEKYESYIKILEEDCGFQFVKKPNVALARKNGESLFGVAISATDKGNYVMDVLFFLNDSDTSELDNNSDSYPSISYNSNEQTATTGDSQALKKAIQYLNYTAFSYDGLIKQLEYEGFSHSEALYGANHCGADWNEEATKKAESYLEFTSFSREGLIAQLEYEGFTHSQAEYGASAVGY